VLKSLTAAVILFSAFPLLCAVAYADEKEQQENDKLEYITDAEEENRLQNNILILKEQSGFYLKQHPANAYIPTDHLWSVTLENKIKKDLPVFQVVSKEIQETASSRALDISRKLFHQYSPDVVIVALGENDGLYSKAINEIKMYLSAIIQMAKNNQAKVILVANQLPIHYGPQYTNDFKKMYVSLAAEYQVAIVLQQQLQIAYPQFYSSYYMIQENAKKEKQMATEKIWPEVEKAIKKENA